MFLFFMNVKSTEKNGTATSKNAQKEKKLIDIDDTILLTCALTTKAQKALELA